MDQYTELLNIKAETLSLDDDNYEESLIEISSIFRDFNEALTDFIKDHGYTGDLTDIAAKAQFLREKFKVNNVKLPRDFKEWFVPNKKLARKTAFQICFAFGLNINETNEFFRCVQFERGFDCHTISEAVYYFCIKNNLSYSEAEEMINQIPMPQKVKSIPEHNIVYTKNIIDELNYINKKNQLIQYITNNIDDFKYNNVTAIKFIQNFWTDISKQDGLAVKEGVILNRFNKFQDCRKKGITDLRSSKDIANDILYQEQQIKPDDYVISTSNASTWIIFSQIIGLSNYMENKYSTNRSLSSILSRNVLMPLNASYCFPSQHSIDKILRGEQGDNELMRKMLIFLAFYTYWAKIIINTNDAYYTATHSDSERCLDRINKYLLESSYSPLYTGNPYDWLFIWALNDKNPLFAFRYYIGEIFAINSEQ